MTVIYLDTSALVKLYVEEKGSELVRRLVADCTMVATSQVAYAEARAAFARAWREGALLQESYRGVVAALQADWDGYLAVQVTGEVVWLAGDLAEDHGLRGFDAIHLASLLTLRRRMATSVIAACWDRKLWLAIRASGIQVSPEEDPT